MIMATLKIILLLPHKIFLNIQVYQVQSKNTRQHETSCFLVFIIATIYKKNHDSLQYLP